MKATIDEVIVGTELILGNYILDSRKGLKYH